MDTPADSIALELSNRKSLRCKGGGISRKVSKRQEGLDPGNQPAAVRQTVFAASIGRQELVTALQGDDFAQYPGAVNGRVRIGSKIAAEHETQRIMLRHAIYTNDAMRQQPIFLLEKHNISCGKVNRLAGFNDQRIAHHNGRMHAVAPGAEAYRLTFSEKFFSCADEC